MPKLHEKFHSANGKRQLLVVDDELINRELLSLALRDSYEVLCAESGEEALRIVEQNRHTLSLILLDLLMPGIHGLDVLKILKADPALRHIPVIVLTADQEAEVASLRLGAIDFIPKPYPQREVILARVLRTIELSEDRDTIQVTERDPLTGLYNREYFYYYAQQYDQHHPHKAMDAIVLDVFHFHMINERYGKHYGDEVLRRIGERVRDMVRNTEGIVCRREADTFLVYCPHREDYEAILENASVGLGGENVGDNRVRLRMGVYADVDKTIEIERRFDRAKIAADTVRNNLLKSIALYDSALHETEIYTEQLLEDFQTALTDHEFTVYFQPKFDIRPDSPRLTSAEALVRWEHPRLGRINPAAFIPLFEENGLIQQLDQYVWRETAAHIRDWKTRLGVSVPVSVNVSRVDMADPQLLSFFTRLLSEYELTPADLLLEITESAYTQDSSRIVDAVNALRAVGFRIEMDDFGSGYSSLNMISSLPFDALKLDMYFIRNAFRGGRDTRMIEVIIDIADYFNVPVIAEGVETKEQLDCLRGMGCDIVQGFYFSPPVPAEAFESFLLRYQAASGSANDDRRTIWDKEISHAVPVRIAQALARDYICIYYVDLDADSFIEYSTHRSYRGLNLENEGRDFFGLCRKNIRRVVHPQDQQALLKALDKETLVRALARDGVYTHTYRLMLEGRPCFVTLRARHMTGGSDPHIVIGISDVDAQIKLRADA